MSFSDYYNWIQGLSTHSYLKIAVVWILFCLFYKPSTKITDLKHSQRSRSIKVFPCRECLVFAFSCLKLLKHSFFPLCSLFCLCPNNMPVFPFLFLSSFHFKEKSKNSCEPLKNGKQCLRRVPRRIWSDFPCLMHRPHAKHCDRARSENILSDCYQRRGGDTTRRFWRLTGMIRMTFQPGAGQQIRTICQSWVTSTS